MPILHVLAGPNGAGKTTFYSTAIESGFIEKSLSFLNVDSIARSLGGYTEANYERASELYREQVKEFIASGSDFMIESNLADSRSYEWLSLVKSKNYNLVLYYLSTKNTVTNVSRIQRRVAEGGHDIPESIVISRYNQSHSYLKSKIMLFKEVYLIDNSTDIPQVQIKMLDGIIVQRASDLPVWILEVISLYERLQNRLR